VTTVGLLLRPDAYLTESADGVYVLTHQGPVMLTGRSVYGLLSRLAPYLDGQHTLAELTADLSVERQEIVAKLIGTLTECGVVREVDSPSSNDASPEARYLGYFQDSPVRTLLEYRALRTTVLGDGPVADAVVRAAVRSGLSDVRTESSSADLVFHVTDSFEGLSHEGRVGQIVLRGSHAWLGIDAPWESVRRRLTARGQDSLGSAVTSSAMATVLATRLVHSVFRVVTGLDSPRPDRVTRVDLSTLEDSVHTVVPFSPSVTSTVSTEILDSETFNRRAVACADNRLGLFSDPDERSLAQIPLRVCEISVSDPVGLLGSVPVVTGTGLDFPTARLRAALRAFACYGSLMVDEARVRDEFVTGYSLDGLSPVPVPAKVAFPVLAGSHSLVGVAAGYSWEEAVTTGLADHCRSLTIAAVDRARGRIDLAAAPLDAAGARYRSMLAAIGLPVTVYDITHNLPTFVAHVDNVPAGCATALTATDALTETLSQAILTYQARENGETVYAPPPPPAMPVVDTVVPLPTSVDLATAAATLTKQGHRPVAVPLDHDPEAAKIMPHMVRVVLLDD